MINVRLGAQNFCWSENLSLGCGNLAQCRKLFSEWITLWFFSTAPLSPYPLTLVHPVSWYGYTRLYQQHYESTTFHVGLVFKKVRFLSEVFVVIRKKRGLNGGPPLTNWTNLDQMVCATRLKVGRTPSSPLLPIHYPVALWNSILEK